MSQAILNGTEVLLSFELVMLTDGTLQLNIQADDEMVFYFEKAE